MKKWICFILSLLILFHISSFQAKNKSPQNQLENLPVFQKILLVIALKVEANAMIKAFNLSPLPQFSKLPMKAYQGKYKKFNLFLVTSGQSPLFKVDNVGSEPAVLTTYLGIHHFHPDLVINIGIAGGIAKNGAQIGDVYVSRRIYYFNRRMPPDKTQYGLGGYPSLNLGTIPKKLGLKSANICSGDSFDYNKTDYRIILKNKCAVRNMEAASVAWVSMLMNTPMIAIKGITDIQEIKNGYQQSLKNRPHVIKKLAFTLKKLLDALSNINKGKK